MLVGSPRALLPAEAYRSAAWYAAEQAQLFGNRWLLVASEGELAGPGDYVTAVAGQLPLVVIRGHDGELRAFHNVCRHRDAVLVAGSGSLAGTVNCFYHHWRYLLDGSLAVVPQRKEQFPGLDLSEWGLLPASLATWEGMVFAHPDPGAAPLSAALEGIPEHLGSYRPGLLHQVATAEIEARCNWKLFVENHIDVYHLWYLHAESLGDYDHTRFEHRFVGANWVSYEALKPQIDLADAALIKGTAPIRHLEPADQVGLRAQLIFPNLMIATSSEFWATYAARPEAPDRCVIDLRIRAEPEADADALLDALRSFIVEDIRACEAVQQATGSPAFAIGPLAQDHERPIARFQAQCSGPCHQPQSRRPSAPEVVCPQGQGRRPRRLPRRRMRILAEGRLVVGSRGPEDLIACWNLGGRRLGPWSARRQVRRDWVSSSSWGAASPLRP